MPLNSRPARTSLARNASIVARVGLAPLGLALLGGGPAIAQDASPTPAQSAAVAQATLGAPIQVGRVTVHRKAIVGTLSRPEAVGSNLGLTQRETPATVNVIDAETMRVRGYSQVEDAVDSAPGVTSGGSPGDPTGFSMRGFTGDEINILRDGVYLGPATIVNRPQNSFNLRDIEILKGPASVLYGQGAVGGVINILTKQPQFGPTHYDALVSYGSFGTVDSGIGVGTQLGKEVAVRLDLSRTSSNGYVHDDDPNSLNFTGSLLWTVTPTLQVVAGIDVLHDSLPSYYGTPLVPATSAVQPLSGLVSSSKGLTIDGATRFANYNVSDAFHKSTDISPSLKISWEPSATVTITNQAYEFYAERRWQNAETYTYIPAGTVATDAAGDVIPAGSVARDRFYVYHQQHLYGDQLHALFANKILGFDNRYTIGIDGSYLDFIRSRGFPSAQYADYVNADAPDQGLFGNFPGLYPQEQSPTHIADVAGLFEDALSLRPDLKLVTGVRYDWLDLDRQNFTTQGIFNPTTSFEETLHPVNFRVGAVYDVIPELTLYGQFTTAQDPPGSDIFLANRGQFQGLSSSMQEEVGAKGQFLGGRLQGTLALYDIQRKNILITTSEDTVTDAGSQRSYGLEFDSDFRIRRDWTLNANAAYTHSRFGTFLDPFTGLNDSGNHVPDVPAVTANLYSVWHDVANLPVDVGGGLRFVGERAGDYANTFKLTSYSTVDVFSTWRVNKIFDVTGRIDNLFDRAYVQWADVNYPTEVLLGRPRYFELSLHAHI